MVVQRVFVATAKTQLALSFDILSGISLDFNVLIVGAGITGWSAAMHLYRLGFSSIGIIDPLQTNTSQLSAPALFASPFDNFTRFSHTWGQMQAASLWLFHLQAYNSLVGFCKDQAIDLSNGRRLRLIDSEHELKEVLLAAQELSASGFNCHILQRTTAPSEFAEFGPAIVGVQDEGNCGATINIKQLMKQLQLQSPDITLIKGSVVSSKESNGGMVLSIEDNGSNHSLKSELVILASHLAIANLEPRLEDVLVPYADQYEVYDFCDIPDCAQFFEQNAGTVFSARHGLLWGCFAPDHKLYLGGGRFLRKWAGVGAVVEENSPLVRQFLDKLLPQYFDKLPRKFSQFTVAGRDCHPCDELPVIGPMYGSDRLLVASGYMGAGLTLGFYAGKCLADLIATGTCQQLPRFLWPHRLRSLASILG